MSIYKEPPPGMCVVADDEDVTKVWDKIMICKINYSLPLTAFMVENCCHSFVAQLFNYYSKTLGNDDDQAIPPL